MAYITTVVIIINKLYLPVNIKIIEEFADSLSGYESKMKVLLISMTLGALGSWFTRTAQYITSLDQTHHGLPSDIESCISCNNINITTPQLRCPTTDENW